MDLLHRSKHSEKGPCVSQQDVDRMVELALDKFTDKLVQRFREELLPDLKKEIFQDVITKAYSEVGKETISLGKKVLVRFTVILGITVILAGTYFSGK